MMDFYSLLREFADSWVLLMMALFFLGVLIWAFRPGSKNLHQEIANSIFQHDQKPAPDAAPTEGA
jgi:cytochrome c oxidase cbb3-type subunit 4